MAKISVAKVTQILGSLFVVIAGIVAALFLLLVSLLPNRAIIVFFGRQTVWEFPEFAPLGWAVAGLFLFLFIDIMLWWTKESFKIEAEKLGYYKAINIWALIAFLYRAREFFWASVAVLAISLVFLAFLYISIGAFVYNPISPSLQFFILLAVFGFYLFLRKPLIGLYVFLGGWLSKRLPVYTLLKDSLMIDLNIKFLLKPSTRKYTVQIKFDELSEIKVFSYVEADAFYQYEIGPNLELIRRAGLEWLNYVRGKLERPSVYLTNVVLAPKIGKILLLKGPKIFYFIAVANKDVSDLINTFQAYKNDRQL